MVLPNLIHPVEVEIERIDTASTTYDELAKEPVGEVQRQISVTVPAQIFWTIKENPSFEERGVYEHSVGYILCRKVDIDALTISPDRGDKIIRIGWEDENLFILGKRNMGHYPDQAGASLIRYDFADRSPDQYEAAS